MGEGSVGFERLEEKEKSVNRKERIDARFGPCETQMAAGRP